MPRVKRERQKLHHRSASTAMEVDNAPNVIETVQEDIEVADNQTPSFRPIIKQSKKDKRYEKRTKWLQRLQLSHVDEKKEEKKKKKKKKQQMDMSAMDDVLRQLDEALAENDREPDNTDDDNSNKTKRNNPKQPKEQDRKSRRITSKKGRAKVAKEEVLQFQNVLRHSAFLASPLATIQQHVKLTANQY